MANINDSSAQYPDLQTGNGVQTNGSTLRENVTNCKVRASEQERNPQAGTRASRHARNGSCQPDTYVGRKEGAWEMGSHCHADTCLR
jgi:hypothetical protein